MIARSPVFYFTLLSSLGSLLTVSKLLTTGLHRRYQIFFYYFIFRVLQTGFSLYFAQDTGSDAYLKFYVVTGAINLAFYVLVVRELWGLILDKYSGIKTLGRWATYLGVSISAVVSVAMIFSTFSHGKKIPQKSLALFTIVGLDRGITLSLAIFLLAMMLFMFRMPVLSRNVVLHASLYSVFFLSNTLSTILKSVFGRERFQAIDAPLMAVGAICAFSWCFFLSRKGEETTVSLPQFSPDQEREALLKLEALNDTLLKVGAK
jgi:hypothetical protein